MTHTYEYYCKKIKFDPLVDSNKLPPLNNPRAVDDRPSPLRVALEALDSDEIAEFEKLYKEKLEEIKKNDEH